MKKVYSTLVGLSVTCSLAFVGCSASKEESAANQKTPATSNDTAKVSSTSTTPASVPDLKNAIEQYRKYVIEQSDALVTNTSQFTDAIKTGNIEKAKQLYASTRQYYERIESIAESFDHLDPDIDARENDVPADEFKGFHHIEKALWQSNTTKGEEKVAEELLNNVKLLRAKVETLEIDPALFVTGPVELLNEVSSSKVTGEEERYSHTDFYDFAANVEGAHQIFTLLQPALQKQNASLSNTVAGRFTDLNSSLASYKKGTDYVLYNTLSQDQMKQLSQKVDALAEPLSQIGTVMGVQQDNGGKK
jgi:iron uptake system component EfeO